MKKLWITGLALVMLNSVYACDVCGGVSGMQGIGFLPNSSFHFIGLTYRYNTFETEHPRLFEDEDRVYGNNAYSTYEIWGRYQLNDRIQLFGFAPYHQKSISDTTNYSLSGFGDLSLLASYRLVKTENLKAFIGAGVKLPTGKSNILVNRSVLIPNLQPGTGSFDGLLSSNLTYFKDKIGLNSELNYTINFPGYWGYKYGNQMDLTCLALYKKELSKSMLVGQFGLKFNQQAKDVKSTTYNIKEVYSGGYALQLPIGLDFYTKNFGTRLRYELPVFSRLAEGYVQPLSSIRAQLLFIINKKEK